MTHFGLLISVMLLALDTFDKLVKISGLGKSLIWASHLSNYSA